MRKLNIASRHQPSPMVRLELEYLTERAVIRRIPFYEEQNLLRRIRSGDAAAIYPLVSSQEFWILKTAKQYLHTKIPVAEMVAAARTAVTRLLHNELTNPGPQHYELFRTWTIRQAIMQVVYNGQPYQQQPTLDEKTQAIALHKNLEQQVPFLNHLNRELKRIEARIVRRATDLLQHGAPQQLNAPDEDRLDVVEARVAYYYDADNNEPVHTFFTHFTYTEVIVNKDFGGLHETVNQTDWHRESYMPPLEETYCYLLHDLIEHSQIKKSFLIHQINRIDISISYRDEWFCDLVNGKGE